MFKLKNFNYYKNKYEIIKNEDQSSYSKITKFHYGKSCTPTVYSKNILFLGIESFLDVIIFHQFNPTSYIYIYGCDDSNFFDEEISHIIYLKKIEDIYYGDIIFDTVKVTKEFLSNAENRKALYKMSGNKLYGDYESIDIPSLQLYLNIRNKFNLFYLVDEMNNQKISGYLKDNNKSDISIIISGDELNHKLKEDLISLKESSKLKFEIIVCLDEKNHNLDHDFIVKNNIILIEEKSLSRSCAWFKGFERSNSEYVLFMYSEDSFYKEIFDELYLLSITTHADIAQPGYNIIRDGNLDNEEKIINDNYGIISNPKSLLNSPPTPWGRLYRSDFLKGIDLNKEDFFEELVFNFLSVSSSNIISLLPDKYYQRYSDNKELNAIQKMNSYRLIYDFIRPYASMEVMAILLELEISNYHEIALKEDSDSDLIIEKLYNQLSICYGDRYRFQEKFSYLRP